MQSLFCFAQWKAVTDQNNCTDTSDCESVTVVGLQENKTYAIHIYPNPTTGILTLEGIKGKFEVYNSYGKLIEVTKSNTLDLSQAASGIYLLKATDENGRAYLLKIVKE